MVFVVDAKTVRKVTQRSRSVTSSRAALHATTMVDVTEPEPDATHRFYVCATVIYYDVINFIRFKIYIIFSIKDTTYNKLIHSYIFGLHLEN